MHKFLAYVLSPKHPTILTTIVFDGDESTKLSLSLVNKRRVSCQPCPDWDAFYNGVAWGVVCGPN
jgi:hypothetical protein